MHCISGIAIDQIRSLSLQIVIVKADLLDRGDWFPGIQIGREAIELDARKEV
jgi:hypothetical protein